MRTVDRPRGRTPAHEALPQTGRRKALGRDCAAGKIRGLAEVPVNGRGAFVPSTLSGGSNACGAVPPSAARAKDCATRERSRAAFAKGAEGLGSRDGRT